MLLLCLLLLVLILTESYNRASSLRRLPYQLSLNTATNPLHDNLVCDEASHTDLELEVVDDVEEVGDASSPNAYMALVAESDKVKIKELTFFYLKYELKLSEATLMKILTKHSWITYLKVESNLKPTIDTFKSFGFKDRDIKLMIELVPSILGINYEWTLPEKLISLQQMYSLNRMNLVKIVTNQPWLLSSSISRNLEINNFFVENMNLNSDDVKKLITTYPTVAMTSINVLRSSWSILTDIYGLDDDIARQMCMKYPRLLSRSLVSNADERIKFFSEELGESIDSYYFINLVTNSLLPPVYIDMPPPFQQLQNLIKRFPQALCIDTDIFLRPNLLILCGYLELSKAEITKMLSVFPQLLGYNPNTLEVLTLQAMCTITGLDEYRLMLEERIEDSNGAAAYDAEIQMAFAQIGNILNPTSKEDDAIGGIIAKYEQIRTPPAVPDNTSSLYYRLNIEPSRAQKVLRDVPWVIAYRQERTRSLLATLGVSLGLTIAELSRVVLTYPRVLSLSVETEGKVTVLLRYLTEYAIKYIENGGSCYVEDSVIEDLDDEAVRNKHIAQLRRNQIRSMVRYVIVKYPLVLGTSLDRIAKRFDDISDLPVEWKSVVTVLRRSPISHETWLQKQK